MTIRYPGLTFSNLIRQPDIEARHQDKEWWDNTGRTVTPVVDEVFVGQIALSDILVASVVRNGFSRGGYLGLYEMAFLNPTKGRLPYGREFYEPHDLDLDGVTLTWLKEDDVTAILQRVARHMEKPALSNRALAIGLPLSILIAGLFLLLLRLAMS